MLCCVDHNNKAYTEKELESIEICEHSGTYQGVCDGKIRVYCFRLLDKAICPKDKNETR